MSGRRPSESSRRAQQLLLGGLAGGHAAAFAAVGLFWALRGAQAGASAAIAAAVTLAFYTIALAVQVAVADAAPSTVLAASLASYVARVSVLGVALAAVLANAQRWEWLDPVALAVTTIAVVLGWLICEVWTFSRLRIPAFDPPEPPRAADPM